MIHVFGDFQLDDRLYSLRRTSESIEVEPQVFTLLAYLIRNRDRVVPKMEGTSTIMWPAVLSRPSTATIRWPLTRSCGITSKLPEWNSRMGFVLFTRYLSADMPDNFYVYDPGKRQVIRLSNVNRSNAIWGTDLDYDSQVEFSGKLNLWTFRVLAEKEILSVAHSGKYGDRSVWCAPRGGKHGILAALPCVSWEKRRVWVIEGIPTGYRESYAYSKRIFYIDQDFFGLVLMELYDQQGELWKGFVLCFFYTTKPYEGYPTNPIEGGKYHYEDEWPFIPNAVMINFREVHATTFEAPPSPARPSE